jgi:hypothetical protein
LFRSQPYHKQSSSLPQPFPGAKTTFIFEILTLSRSDGGFRARKGFVRNTNKCIKSVAGAFEPAEFSHDGLSVLEFTLMACLVSCCLCCAEESTRTAAAIIPLSNHVDRR